MPQSRERTLWDAIEKFKVLLALAVLYLLVMLYWWIMGGPLAHFLRQLLLDIIANLVAVILSFAVLYAFFRRIEKVRGDMERDELADIVARKTADLCELGHKAGLRPRQELGDLSSQAPEAKDILLIGRSLGTVLRDLAFFEERLKQGAHVRLVMFDVRDEAVLEAVDPHSESLPSDVQTSLGWVRQIAKDAPEAGELEVRLTRSVPTLSLAAVDAQGTSGHIVVELVPYGISSGRRPHLLLRATEDPVWFCYFRDVAERIWQDAHPHDFTQNLAGS